MLAQINAEKMDLEEALAGWRACGDAISKWTDRLARDCATTLFSLMVLSPSQYICGVLTLLTLEFFILIQIVLKSSNFIQTRNYKIKFIQLGVRKTCYWLM